MHGFRGGINFSEWQAREESTKKKMKTLVLLDFSVLTDESSPVEKIAPNLCGMKASFEQYIWTRIMATAQWGTTISKTCALALD